MKIANNCYCRSSMELVGRLKLNSVRASPFATGLFNPRIRRTATASASGLSAICRYAVLGMILLNCIVILILILGSELYHDRPTVILDTFTKMYHDTDTF